MEIRISLIETYFDILRLAQGSNSSKSMPSRQKNPIKKIWYDFHCSIKT